MTACTLWLTLGQLGIPVSVYDEVRLHSPSSLSVFGLNICAHDVQSWEGYELRPGNPVKKGGVITPPPAEAMQSSAPPAWTDPFKEVSAGATTGKVSYPEMQIKLDELEDDGTPDVGEVLPE